MTISVLTGNFQRQKVLSYKPESSGTWARGFDVVLA